MKVFLEQEANGNHWEHHSNCSPVTLIAEWTKLARGSTCYRVSPGRQKKLIMSERCNLKALTAALCCFYHKNSVISAKVRLTGERVWGCGQVLIVFVFVLCVKSPHLKCDCTCTCAGVLWTLASCRLRAVTSHFFIRGAQFRGKSKVSGLFVFGVLITCKFREIL